MGRLWVGPPKCRGKCGRQSRRFRVGYCGAAPQCAGWNASYNENARRFRLVAGCHNRRLVAVTAFGLAGVQRIAVRRGCRPHLPYRPSRGIDTGLFSGSQRVKTNSRRSRLRQPVAAGAAARGSSARRRVARRDTAVRTDNGAGYPDLLASVVATSPRRRGQGPKRCTGSARECARSSPRLPGSCQAPAGAPSTGGGLSKLKGP